jgi:NAD+ kinase
MKNLGVIANCGKPHAAEVLERLGRKARALGMRVLADGEAARWLRTAKTVSSREMFKRIDVLVALGGDGTMLRAVRELDGLDKPVLGVNIGSLGFLTSVAEEDLERALDCLADGHYSTSTRSMAECFVLDGRRRRTCRALNDVVVTCGGSSRLMTLDLSVDGQDVTSFLCDGMIVCTPTGSTGHSLSAGGPIVVPGSPVFVVALICAHTLSTRPLVIPDSAVLKIRVAKSSGSARLAVDGQVEHSLSPGVSVEVKRSSASVRFIHLPGYSYFSVLRQKLHWRGSNV